MPRSVRKKLLRTPRGKRTPRHTAGSGGDSSEAETEEVLRPKSKRRALFTSKSDTSAGDSAAKTKSPSPEKVQIEQKTPPSTRLTRSRQKRTTTPPQETNNTLTETPRSKRATRSSTCRTPVTKDPMAVTDVMCTPKSSKRIMASGEGVYGTPRSRRSVIMKQPQCSMSTLCGWYRETAQDTGKSETLILAN